MEKINFVNGKSPYISATNLNNLQDNVENAINGIIESGSNANGSYIKFSDGTMICRKTVLFENVAITNAWGSFFESEVLSLGDYAQPFVEEPDIALTSHYPNFIEKEGNVSTTSFGNFYAAKPRSISSEKVKVSCIAIGKWK